MPTITTKAYMNEYNSYNFFLPNNVVDIVNEAINKNYKPLENYLKNHGNPYVKVSWEFAIETSSPNINKGAPLSIIFEGEATLIHPLAIYGGAPVIELLSQYDVDFNQSGTFKGSYNGTKPIDGTPLHIIAGYQDAVWEDISLLLDKGALPNIANSSGQTVSAMLDQAGNTELSTKLTDYMQQHEMNFESITAEEYIASQKVIADPVEADISMIQDSATSGTPKSLSDYFQHYVLDWFEKKAEPIKLADVIETSGDMLPFADAMQTTLPPAQTPAQEIMVPAPTIIDPLPILITETHVLA
jgi:hypothetical protein